MDINILYIVISAILAVLLMVLVGKLGIANEKWIRSKVLLKELAEALTATSIALQDDKLTDKERDELLREWRDVIISARDLI